MLSTMKIEQIDADSEKHSLGKPLKCGIREN